MADKKNYKAATGVSEFYYGIINDGITADKVYRVQFLQEISVESDGSVEKAYGDNQVAELAYAKGETTVTSQFHTIPMEDKKRLFGFEEKDGIMASGSSDHPPYVACVFAKTHEDGSREYVGLPKGMFMPPNIEGESKEDGVEFSSEESEAEFMDREVDGFDEKKAMLMAYVEKGEDDKKDDIFDKLFGEDHELIEGSDDGDNDGGNDDSDGDESGEA